MLCSFSSPFLIFICFVRNRSGRLGIFFVYLKCYIYGGHNDKKCVIIVEYHWDGSIEKEEIPMYKTGGRWYVLDDTVFDLIDDYE